MSAYNHATGLSRFAEMFRALGGSTRLRICRLLLECGGGLCVCELVDALEEPQYNVSRHLKALKSAGLVVERQEGRWVYYELPAQESPFVEALLTAVRTIPLPALTKEIQGLRQRLSIRKDGKCLIGVQKTHLLSRAGITHRYGGD